MEYRDLLKKRQSIRKYKEQDIPKEDLLKIIEAATYAPSGKNMQNWHFVVITRKTLKDKLVQTIQDKNAEIAAKMATIDEAKGLRFQKFCKNFTLFIEKAPAVIVIYGAVYLPSGYHELELFGESAEVLISRFNPGLQSIGAAVENITLEAVNMGYGSCWLTSANYAADEIEEVIKQETGFQKEGYSMVAMLSVGVPADGTHKSPKKKTVEQIHTFIG